MVVAAIQSLSNLTDTYKMLSRDFAERIMGNANKIFMALESTQTALEAERYWGEEIARKQTYQVTEGYSDSGRFLNPMRFINPNRSKTLQDRKGWVEGWESKIKADEFIHGLGIGEAYLRQNGKPAKVKQFGNMPVILVAYSGGYLPASYSIRKGGIGPRLRGVVLLDALYAELDKFERFITGDRTRFFVSGYLRSTRAQNLELQRMLGDKNIALRTSLDAQLRPGSVTFIPGNGEVSHTDYVTRAWVDYPITDLLNRLPEYRR